VRHLKQKLAPDKKKTGLFGPQKDVGTDYCHRLL
jgi:hypothetical protein